MNGHFHSPPEKPESDAQRSTTPPPIPIREDEDTAFLRLCAALAASCFLHLAVLVIPYLGKTVRQPRTGSVAVEDRARKPLQATLRILSRNHPAPYAVTPPPLPDIPLAPQEDHALTLTTAEQMQFAELSAAQVRSEGADLLPIQAPLYFPAEQLTKAPQPTVSADLDPAPLQPIVASGSIVLKLWIDPQGAVGEVAVEKSDMPEAFSHQAIAAFRALRFIPGERNGQHVGSVIRVEVNYEDGRARNR